MKHPLFTRLLLAAALFFSAASVSAATNCATVTEIPSAECASLLEFYNSTGGPNWTNKTGWNVTQTPCSWFGVTCGSGHVIELNLSSTKIATNFTSYLKNNLIGVLPDLNLPFLEKLDISGNPQLTGVIPNFTRLSSLIEIYLLFNNLTGDIPNFSNIKKLQSLFIYGNQLTGAIPNFSNIPNLQSLSLGGNQLTGAIPNFSNIPNLQSLSLGNYFLFGGGGNQLSGTIPNFNYLQNLQSLDIAYNYLSGSIPNFSNLPNLTSLYLHDNQLNGALPNFSNIPNLKSLFLSNNHLSGAVPNFSHLPNLTWLSLRKNCGLTTSDPTLAAFLDQRDPDWRVLGDNCPAVPTLNLTVNGLANATLAPYARVTVGASLGGAATSSGAYDLYLVMQMPTGDFWFDPGPQLALVRWNPGKADLEPYVRNVAVPAQAVWQQEEYRFPANAPAGTYTFYAALKPAGSAASSADSFISLQMATLNYQVTATGGGCQTQPCLVKSTQLSRTTPTELTDFFQKIGELRGDTLYLPRVQQGNTDFRQVQMQLAPDSNHWQLTAIHPTPEPALAGVPIRVAGSQLQVPWGNFNDHAHFRDGLFGLGFEADNRLFATLQSGQSIASFNGVFSAATVAEITPKYAPTLVFNQVYV